MLESIKYCCNAMRVCKMLALTTCLIQKNGGHQELPGVVEKCFLYEVEGRARWSPLLEGLPPGWAEACVQIIYKSL